MTHRSLVAIATLAVVFLGRAPASPAISRRPAQFPRAAQQAETVTLTLLSTTDIHGHIEPFDDLTQRPAHWGLARIATLIRRIRAQNPNVVLLDCGDLIEGTPLAYYFDRKNPRVTNPVVAAMNSLDYDAMAVGNHDFDFGLDVLWRAKEQSHFPWLAANIHQDYANGARHFEPYIIKNVAGVRIGIVGFVTPSVPRWEIRGNYRGYRFEPIVETALRIIPDVRRQADLVVAIMHSGLDRDPRTGRKFNVIYPQENTAWETAEQVPGIDILFYGHTHEEMPELFVNGVLLAQARNWGQSLAEADVTMQRDHSGRWRVARKRSQTISAGSAEPDPAIERLDEPYNREVQRYLDVPLAISTRALSAKTGRVDDNALVDLIHRTQLTDGKADVSLATIFVPSLEFPAGRITVRQIYFLYPYENRLYTVEMTGAQLEGVLEHSAGFFPAWPARRRVYVPGFNADSAEGVSYQIDLTKPVGHRIENLAYQGRPLRPGRKLRVAINSYRYAGGGGYRALASLPVVYRSEDDERDLIIAYLRVHHRISVQPDGNWRVVPPEAREALIRAAEAPGTERGGVRRAP